MLAGGAGEPLLVPAEVATPVSNGLVLAAASHADNQVEQKIGGFKAYFDDVMAKEHSRFFNMSIRSGADGVQLYNLQLAFDGVLSMFEATRSRDVLDKAVLYSRNMMNSARVIQGGLHEADGYLDWEALSGGQPLSRRQGFLIYDFQMGSALSRLARIIHEDARLQDDAGLKQFGAELTQFVNRQIVHKWLDVRNQRRWLERFHDTFGYWTDKATHIINICHNLSAVMGDRSRCAGIELDLAQHFRDLLVVQDDGAYLWGVWSTLPSGFNHLAPDTAHENRVATMITQLGADQFVFDLTDIMRLGKTFTERIWNGRTDWEADPGVEESPWFHNYIDGSDESYRNIEFFRHGPEGMNGFAYDGWVRLGQFVPEVQQAGEALLSFIQAFGSSVNAIHRRNGSVFGKVALVGHLARNLRLAQTVPDSTEPSLERTRRDPVRGTDVGSNHSVKATTAVELPRLAGDANLDGIVSFSDFLVLSSNFGGTERIWDEGDFNDDGAVTISDFVILTHSFGKTLV